LVAQVIENLDIIYSVTGQSLAFDCPEGRPSSVTSSTVFENDDGDDGTAEVATTGSAAIETNPDTTFDAASGDGQGDPRICSLTATTGIALRRRYLATNADLETEWVDVIAVDSAASATARHPLSNAYTTADTFESTRITHAVDSTWVADKNNISPAQPYPRYRWRLEYVVASVTYVQQVYFDLVRYSGTTTVTGPDVDRAFPWLGWMHRMTSEDREDVGARVIAEAYRQVKIDLMQASKADQAARNREVMEDLVVHKAAALSVRPDEPGVVEFLEAKYQTRYNNFIVTPKLKFDADGSGAARPSHSSPVWRR
jgi:hypothetical protein